MCTQRDAAAATTVAAIASPPPIVSGRASVVSAFLRGVQLGVDCAIFLCAISSSHARAWDRAVVPRNRQAGSEPVALR